MVLRIGLLLLGLVACASGPQSLGGGAAGDGSPTTSYDGSSPDGTSEGVVCPNPLRPKQAKVCSGATPVCCLAGALGVTPSCVASREACSGSKISCDDATDCAAGQACCSMQTQGGSGSGLSTQCRNQCSLIEQPVCNGTGTCKGDQRCCQDEGDIFGTCVGAAQSCPVDTGG